MEFEFEFSRITNEFAAAAFRVGHTMIPNLFKTVASNGRETAELLRDLFSNVDGLRGRRGVDALLRGLVTAPVENVDDNFAEEVTDHLFDGDESQLDLVALNIQRARDHGVPGYVRYREICRVDGRRRVRDFDDLSSNINRRVRQIKFLIVFALLLLSIIAFATEEREPLKAN